MSAFKDAPFPLTGQQASTVAGFRGTKDDANRLLRHLYAQGVLQRGTDNPSAFSLAPPPPPPGAAVLIDLDSKEILALASKPNYDLSSLTHSFPKLHMMIFNAGKLGCQEHGILVMLLRPRLNW